MKKRIVSLCLVLALCAALLPGAALAADSGAAKTMQLGAAVIDGYNTSSKTYHYVYYGAYQQSSYTPSRELDGLEDGKVYTDLNGTKFVYVNYTTKGTNATDVTDCFKIEPVQWRVLSAGSGELFLLSEKCLDTSNYNKQKMSVTWATSSVRSWLNGYNASSNQPGIDYTTNSFIGTAFSENERNAIVETSVTDGVNATASSDKIYLLSKDEAQKTEYGFSGGTGQDAARVAYTTLYEQAGGTNHAGNTNTSTGSWWLRTLDAKDQQKAYSVRQRGGIETNGVADAANWDIRPAFNLDTSNVLFTSAASGGKASGTVGKNALSAVSDVTSSGAEWKLTLKDSSRSGFKATTTAYDKDNGIITITYSGAAVGANEYVSAIIVGSDNTIKYYGRVVQPENSEGELTIDLSDKISEGDKLKIFSEQYNGEKMTDYASDLKEVSLDPTTGSLIVSKTVKNEENSDTEFTFTVSLMDADGTAVTGTFDGVEFDSNGEATFTLKDGESKKISGIPKDTKYTVTEAEEANYKTESTNNATGTIKAATETKVTFTNSLYGSLTVSKTVKNEENSDTEFTFTVSLTDKDDNPLVGMYGNLTFDEDGKATFELKNGESVTISDLPAGTKYTVTEEPDEDLDYIITSPSQGVAEGTIGKGVKTEVFTSTRIWYGSLLVSKTVSGIGASRTQEFTFTVALPIDQAVDANALLYANVKDGQEIKYYGNTFTWNKESSQLETSFTLKHGESREISRLPIGTSYIVTESKSDGYTVKINGEKQESLEGKINSTAQVSIAFENASYSGLLLLDSLLPAAMSNVLNAPFKDVSFGSYYYNAVSWANERGIASGTSANYFSPDDSCTRAQAVTMLWRAAGCPDVWGENPFVDVDVNDYYYEAVLWAVANGITSGTDATHFSPDEPCTRGQIVTFLHRAARCYQAHENFGFTDVKTGSYCEDAVNWAVETGITNGTSEGTFSPDSVCTRAQIVTFLYRNR